MTSPPTKGKPVPAPSSSNKFHFFSPKPRKQSKNQTLSTEPSKSNLTLYNSWWMKTVRLRNYWLRWDVMSWLNWRPWLKVVFSSRSLPAGRLRNSWHCLSMSLFKKCRRSSTHFRGNEPRNYRIFRASWSKTSLAYRSSSNTRNKSERPKITPSFKQRNAWLKSSSCKWPRSEGPEKPLKRP